MITTLRTLSIRTQPALKQCTHNLRHNRRGLSTSPPDAYLENIVGKQGIAALTLNRPQAKNAISVNLLKVSSLFGALIVSLSTVQQLRESLDKVAFDPS